MPKKTHTILLILVLLLAAAFRLYGLRWEDDLRNYPHPDERHLANTMGRLSIPSPVDWALLNDPDHSPLNPRRLTSDEGDEHYDLAYGTLPVYVYRAAAVLLARATGRPDLDTYYAYGTIGRVITAILSLLTVVWTYDMGRRTFGPQVALLAAAFLAACVLHIQLSHFMTVDLLMSAMLAAGLLFAVRFAQGGRTVDAVGMGAMLGLGMACKFNGITLGAGIAAAYAVAWLGGRRRLGDLLAYCVPLTLLFWGIGFTAFEYFSVRDPYTYVHAIGVQAKMVSGETDWPYTRQYVNTAPYLFQLRNLVAWGMGWPLGVAAVGGVLAWTIGLLADLVRSAGRASRSPQSEPQSAGQTSRPPQSEPQPHQTSCAPGIGLMPSRRCICHCEPPKAAKQSPRNIARDRFPSAGSGQAVAALLRAASRPQGVGAMTMSRDNATALGARAQSWLHGWFGDPGRAGALAMLGWAVPFTAYTARLEVKFLRYMLPLTPVLCLFAADLVWRLGGLLALGGRHLQGRHGTGKGTAHPGGLAALRWSVPALVLLPTLLWALAFMRVYAQEHPWQAASRWFYAQVPDGSTYTWEAWGDPLPTDLPAEGLYRQQHGYRDVWMRIYLDMPPQDKVQHIADSLRQADYVVLSTPRIYLSVARLPWRYPVEIRYYELLFSGQLGYELAAKFTARPGLGPWTIDDLSADQSFYDYEHPLVLVFRKVRDLSDREWAALFAEQLQADPQPTRQGDAPPVQLPIP